MTGRLTRCFGTDLLLILCRSSVSSPKPFKTGLGCGEILPTIALALSLLVWASLRFIVSGAGYVCVYVCVCLWCVCVRPNLCVRVSAHPYVCGVAFLSVHLSETLLHFVKKDLQLTSKLRV